MRGLADHLCRVVATSGEGPERGKPHLFVRRMSRRELSGLSIEHEGIICEVLGRQLFPRRHHFERINLPRCAGKTGFALWDCPCGESDDRGGGGDCEQSGLGGHFSPSRRVRA